VAARALYSASYELLETIGYFFECHEMGEFPKYII